MTKSEALKLEYRLVNRLISYKTRGLQYQCSMPFFFKIYRILRNYQKFLTIFVISIIINNINVMLAK